MVKSSHQIHNYLRSYKFKQQWISFVATGILQLWIQARIKPTHIAQTPKNGFKLFINATCHLIRRRQLRRQYTSPSTAKVFPAYRLLLLPYYNITAPMTAPSLKPENKKKQDMENTKASSMKNSGACATTTTMQTSPSRARRQQLRHHHHHHYHHTHHYSA